MKIPMKCILFGGSGQVGGAVARALIQSDTCSGLTMVVRRSIPALDSEQKVTQVVTDTSAADFEALVTQTAQAHDVAISCIGIGSGTFWMDETEMMNIEVHMVEKFARGCKAAGIEIFELLTAVGVYERHVNSKLKPFRVMAKKLTAVRDVGFKKLAVFQPGMIVGNSHTPSWMTVFTALIPDSVGWGNIDQEVLGRAFAAHLKKRAAQQQDPVISYRNQEMKALVQE